MVTCKHLEQTLFMHIFKAWFLRDLDCYLRHKFLVLFLIWDGYVLKMIEMVVYMHPGSELRCQDISSKYVLPRKFLSVSPSAFGLSACH